MRKSSFILIILALVLVVGLAFVSCDIGSNSYTITIDNAYSDRTITRIQISRQDRSSGGNTVTFWYETVYDENITIAPGSSRRITFKPGIGNASVPGRITYWPNGTYKSVTLRDGGFYTIP